MIATFVGWGPSCSFCMCIADIAVCRCRWLKYDAAHNPSLVKLMLRLHSCIYRFTLWKPKFFVYALVLISPTTLESASYVFNACSVALKNLQTFDCDIILFSEICLYNMILPDFFHHKSIFAWVSRFLHSVFYETFFFNKITEHIHNFREYKVTETILWYMM